MQSAEMDKLIQIITDRIVAQLMQDNQSSIIFRDTSEDYPAPYVQKLSADHHLVFGSKQDSDAILLCLSQITIPQLLAIANLTAIDGLSRQVIDFLLAGKPVWIFAAAPKLATYRHQTRYAVWHELQHVLQKLTTFDIHFIKDDRQFDQGLKVLQNGQRVKQGTRKYITKHVLQDRWQHQQTLLNSGEVLTDMAAEWARDRRLNL